MWTHCHSAVTMVLDGARAGEGPWRFFISSTVNPPLTRTATNLRTARSLSMFQHSKLHTSASHQPNFIAPNWSLSRTFTDRTRPWPTVTARCGRVSRILLRLFQILSQGATRMIRGFSQANASLALQTKSHPFPSKSLPINYLSVILTFDYRSSEPLEASLNRSQIN